MALDSWDNSWDEHLVAFSAISSKNKVRLTFTLDHSQYMAALYIAVSYRESSCGD